MTPQTLAGILAAREASRLNIRTKDGLIAIYNLELSKVKNETIATVTPNGKIKFEKFDK